MSGLTALVLAGSRGPGDPLAMYAGVTHKALIEIGGVPMVQRVVSALAAVPVISRIIVMIERPELLSTHAGLHAAAGRCELEVITAADSPSSSVLAGIAHAGTPLLVTTADHALLEPRWVQHFIDAVSQRPGTDVFAALARSEAVLAALPATRRTWLRFRGGRYSGCNLFYFSGPAGISIARLWREFEVQRKHPIQMIRRLGVGFALAYLMRLLTLDAALKRLGALAGARLGVIEMPFGLAAVDVDKPSDLDLVRDLIDKA